MSNYPDGTDTTPRYYTATYRCDNQHCVAETVTWEADFAVELGQSEWLGVETDECGICRKPGTLTNTESIDPADPYDDPNLD